MIDNASTSHMKRPTKGIGPLEADACVDVYDFQPQDFMAIKDGDPRVASALTLVDDGFGDVQRCGVMDNAMVCCNLLKE